MNMAFVLLTPFFPRLQCRTLRLNSGQHCCLISRRIQFSASWRRRPPMRARIIAAYEAPAGICLCSLEASSRQRHCERPATPNRSSLDNPTVGQAGCVADPVSSGVGQYARLAHSALDDLCGSQNTPGPAYRLLRNAIQTGWKSSLRLVPAPSQARPP